MSTMWVVLIVVFVVGPALRWGSGGYWGGRRRGRFIWDQDSGTRQQLAEVMAALDQRGAEVEALQSRVTELENRLDFAERLLAERRTAGLIAGEVK